MTLKYGAAITATGDESIPILSDPAFYFLEPGLQKAGAERLLSDPLRAYFGERVTVEVEKIRAIRHRPGVRCLLEYDVVIRRPSGSAEPLALLGKVGARAVDKRSFRLQSWLWSNGFSDDDVGGVGVPEPIALVQGLQMWLQRRVRAESPIELLRGARAAETGARIANALNRLHDAQYLPSRVHTISDELEILRQRLATLTRERPHWRHRIRRILQLCEELARSLDDRPVCTIHRDFYQDQVLVDSQRVYLLDLDLVAVGDPALDIGNFIGHLIEFGLRTDRSAMAFNAACEAMTAQYRANRSDPDGRAAVDAFTTLTLVRHVQISTRFPDRHTITEPLLELCEHRLGLSKGP